MKKIININLYGRVIPIEDAAYDSLQRYIESLRRYFAKEEGSEEIINDIESRISELMNDKIKKGAPCITEADINEIITAMGKVEDFEAADRDETLSGSDKKQSSSTSASYQPRTEKFKGRLYRDVNDKFLGGVCSGIAAYMNVDPTVVRLLFAIITFGGFGLGFLLYIILWIVLPASTIESYSGKRFFRNPDDRIIGGVAGGLAAYFNKNTWTIRLIFAAPILLKVALSILNVFGSAFHSDLTFDIAFGSVTTTFVVAYIILWIVLPEALTSYDKMEMRGERVDVNRIRQNVQEGMSDFKTRAKDFGDEVKSAAQNFSSRASTFSKERGWDFVHEGTGVARQVSKGIGHAIGVLFKSFFLFIAGVIAFSLFVGVLIFTFGGVAQPVNNFLLEGVWQKASMWGVLLFFLAVPLIAILTWVIRRAMKVRSQNRYLGWIFGGLWALGWICVPIFITSLVKDFRFTERTENTVSIAQPHMNKLIVEVPQKAIRYNGNYSWLTIDDDSGWDINDDSLKLSNVRINVKQSDDSSYHVTLYKYGSADNRNKAQQRAEKIEYSVANIDSVLQLGSGFGLAAADKFRNQRVMVEISIPIGKQIRFDHSVADKLNPFNVRISENERYNRKRYWSRRDYQFDWDGNFFDYDPDTDYYMTTKGELKKVGVPEVENPSTPVPEKRDSIYKKILDSLKKNQNEDAFADPEREEKTTMKKNMGGDLPTPVSMPFVPTIF